MIQNVLALVFAGARTARLSILEEKRTNTAIPFGGNYRLIDFALSNLANSGINKVGVLTQYRPSSLIEHLNHGKPWDLIGRSREIRVLPPYTATNKNSWYKGTADAIYQNIDYIKNVNSEHVLFLSGEDIYHFDYNELYEYHKAKDADVTIVGKYVDIEDLSRFGNIKIDKNNRVVEYVEKPNNPKDNLVFLSIAIFKRDVLLEAVEKDAKDDYSRHSFSADVLAELIKIKKVYLFLNNRPWYYIGNIKEYWQTSMAMLIDNSDITPEQWGIRTNLDDRDRCYRKPAFIMQNGNVKNSIIGKGAEIDGEVISSIIFPGVKIAKNAIVRHSVIMHDCQIDKDAFIDMAVLDKDVKIGEAVNIGVGPNIPNKKDPHNYNFGISVIGKKVKVPSGIMIGKNCLIYNKIDQYDFKDSTIPSGESVFR